MIEHMRQEQRIIDQIFDGRGIVSETAPTPAGPGTTAIRIDGRVVGWGVSFRAALRSTEDRTVEIRRLTEAERQLDRRIKQRDVEIPLPEAHIPPAGVGSLE